MFAPLEHEEDGAENFVADGDDGALVATPNDERLELGLEDGCRSAGGMSELAKQATDVEVALAKLAGLALAGRLVVARADADPGSQTIRTAEGIHIGANLNQQHGGADQVDTGNRLQQRQGVALGFEFGQQASIEARNAGFGFLNVPHQFIENEAVAGRQFSLQGIEDFLPTSLQASAGQLQNFTGWLTGDNRLDHGTGRSTMEITHHDPQANTRIGQYLV